MTIPLVVGLYGTATILVQYIFEEIDYSATDSLGKADLITLFIIIIHAHLKNSIKYLNIHVSELKKKY